MNIAVVNIKDIVRYALKIGITIILIYICTQIFNGIKVSKEDKLKQSIENSTHKINKNSLVKILDISMPLISYKNKKDDTKNTIISNRDILAMGTGIFDKSIFQNTYSFVDEKDFANNDKEESKQQIEEISKDAITEEVNENNIEAKYTNMYKDIKINNQSKYNITKEMLVPDIEITNKKDILIYHTHTCESYTPSPRV